MERVIGSSVDNLNN